MDKVTVIGMDLGDENHKAVGLSEGGGIVLREEVSCTPAGVRALLKAHPGALLAVETGTHCRGARGSGWSWGARCWSGTRGSCG